MRRFVTLVTNIAAGKLDHKKRAVFAHQGALAVSSAMPLTMTTESQARYSLSWMPSPRDPQQCAALYRRYYPPLNSAYKELGEKTISMR
ncbi:MAG: DUF3014 domain-containing protein [Cellvibrionales bacterium]|nr:DUF3014 domain-containing protein [Cellvibrionales bacterium]